MTHFDCLFSTKSCSMFSVDGYVILTFYLCYCGTKFMKMGSSSAAAVCLKCLVFCWSSGWSVGSFYLFIISCVWLFLC
jgi:hypothetical protein